MASKAIQITQNSKARSTESMEDGAVIDVTPADGLRDARKTDSKGLAKHLEHSSLALRRATGPRTLRGKERSKHNALKHGIFSQALLLKSESRSEFDSVLSRLYANLAPVGALEELLVEKLAALIWRYRRLLAAEAGGIRKKTELVESDQDKGEKKRGDVTVPIQVNNHTFIKWIKLGLVRSVDGTTILRATIELLTELRKSVETNGLRSDKDQELLNSIYAMDDRLRYTIGSEYEMWSKTKKSSEEGRQENKYPSPTKCLTNLLDTIANEIRKLETLAQERKQADMEKAEIDRLCGSIPGPLDMERLIRYETTLERALDRTLNQIERLQRLRLGQPVLPAIQVDVSTS
ncbi:MAG TPA: hypothetical protein VEJ46_09535 [Candidatus Acidoferrum sp.]|nr:hypothetical protein [Candidatus Acidoferrum sp.]